MVVEWGSEIYLECNGILDVQGACRKILARSRDLCHNLAQTLLDTIDVL
jgi:hypothetical protein